MASLMPAIPFFPPMAAICFIASAWNSGETLVSCGQNTGSIFDGEKRWLTVRLAIGMNPEAKYCAVAMVRCIELAYMFTSSAVGTWFSGKRP